MNDLSPTIGDNRPPPFERLDLRAAELIDGASNLAKQHPVIAEKAVADNLRGFVLQLRDTRSEADVERKKEKQPHLDASREVDEKWGRIIKGLDVALNVALPILSRWEKQERDERERVAREAREKAEAERRAAEEARRKAEEEAAKFDQGKSSDPVAAEIALNEAEAKAKRADQEAKLAERAKSTTGLQYVGASGKARAVALRKIKHCTIVDQDLVYRYFRHDPKLKEFLLALATAAIRQSPPQDVPGIETTIEEKAV